MYNFPFALNRRLRANPSIRELVSEYSIHPHQIIKPIFVHLSQKKILLPELPNSSILSFSDMLREVEKLLRIGIQGIYSLSIKVCQLDHKFKSNNDNVLA